jgi:hypothetical protein
MAKYKRPPTNQLLPDLPDFNQIKHCIEYLEKRPATLSEIRHYQDVWNEYNDIELKKL